MSAKQKGAGPGRDHTFAEHQLVGEPVVTDKVGSWLLRNPDHGSFWCRVTAADGHLTVTGDIGPVVFASGPSKPLETVEWIGGCAEDDGYYPAQKAVIGMRIGPLAKRHGARGLHPDVVFLALAAIRRLHALVGTS